MPEGISTLLCLFGIFFICFAAAELLLGDKRRRQ